MRYRELTAFMNFQRKTNNQLTYIFFAVANKSSYDISAFSSPHRNLQSFSHFMFNLIVIVLFIFFIQEKQ